MNFCAKLRYMPRYANLFDIELDRILSLDSFCQKCYAVAFKSVMVSVVL